MLGVPLGNSLRLCHCLIYRTENDTVGRFLNKDRAASLKPETLPNAHRQAHAAIRRDVYLKAHVAPIGRSGMLKTQYHE